MSSIREFKHVSRCNQKPKSIRKSDCKDSRAKSWYASWNLFELQKGSCA